MFSTTVDSCRATQFSVRFQRLTATAAKRVFRASGISVRLAFSSPLYVQLRVLPFTGWNHGCIANRSLQPGSSVLDSLRTESGISSAHACRFGGAKPCSGPTGWEASSAEKFLSNRSSTRNSLPESLEMTGKCGMDAASKHRLGHLLFDPLRWLWPGSTG